VDKGGVERQGAAGLEERGDLGQEHRRVVRASLLHRIANVGAYEQRVVPEMAFHARRDVRSRAFGVEVDDLDASESWRPIDERVDQHLRSCGAPLHIHPAAGGDFRHGSKRAGGERRNLAS